LIFKRLTRQLQCRVAFFQAAMAHPFRITAASVDKHDPAWRDAGASVIHWACAVSLAVNMCEVYWDE
jgi:hypothetical protein